jgi:uncharacterized membrane protein YkoI
MRIFSVLTLLVLFAYHPALLAQQQSGALQRCLEAALAEKKGEIVKLEVETTETSTESYNPPKGTSVFEIEIRTAEGEEWELTCEEATGKIVEIEREVPKPSHALFKPKAKVTEEAARKVALAAKPGKIVETEYEIEADGSATYEFDIEPAAGGDEWKVEVDASTGKVVETRLELYQIGEEPSSER